MKTKHTILVLRRLPWLLGPGLAVSSVHANDLDLPPPAQSQPARIRIPMQEAEDVMDAREGAETTDEELAAFTLASSAQGWIPEGSSGIIRNGMMIRISVMVQGRNEIATEPLRINQTGQVGLPLLNNVRVGGMDLSDIETMLTEGYADYFRDPLVTVEYIGSTDDPSLSPWGFVTMMGNVASPGPLAMPPTGLLTVSGAVKRSGGMAASANKGAIRIFRPIPEEDSVDVIRVDLNVLGRRGEHGEDVPLRAGDVVFIPERIF